ncbi:MAG: carboxypeptidase regulatory-like domain-containing protein [Bacteroidetes bacterium]|nr:carboxypeptidase regulatory-like domain-containing protein [Bacteroidota bacterium]
MQMRNFPLFRLAGIFITTVFLASCKKTEINTINTVRPDFATTIEQSKIYGFITDENDLPAYHVSVKAGSSTATTNRYGYFEINNATVLQDAATVTVTKPGYFNTVKSFIANGKPVFFRIKLLPKTVTGSFNAATGGTVTTSNGLSVSLPPASVIDAATRNVYSGTVTVSAQLISAGDAEINSKMPGNLRGINHQQYVQLLTTYGMAAVELTGSSGELLQIANNKKAILTIPVPPSMSAEAPVTIPMWYFDESSGFWIEDGKAGKTGNNYIGEVSHFSFWNCDYSGPAVLFDCTVLSAAGIPVSNALVKISDVNNPANVRTGFANADGYVSGLVPANSFWLLEVFPSANCTTPGYSQLFQTGSNAISLGNIMMSQNSSMAVITGNVTDCSNAAVTNGVIYVNENNLLNIYPLNNGSFSFNRWLCNSTGSLTIFAEDITHLLQSPENNYTIQAGNNNLGTLTACSINAQEFFYYNLDGTNYTMTIPEDTLSFNGDPSWPEAWIFAKSSNAAHNYVTLQFHGSGMALGTSHNIVELYVSQVPNLRLLASPVPVYVKLTEFGLPGQFIAGNYNGTFSDLVNPLTTHSMAVKFRLKRY